MDASDLLSLVKGVKIETAYLPPIELRDPFGAGGGAPNPLLAALKPRITIDAAFGGPITVAPYGDPGESRWPLVQAGLVLAGGAIGLWLLSRLLRRR